SGHPTASENNQKEHDGPEELGQHVKTVHTIFKTHLDLGFTDLAQSVVAQYFDEYIPQAIETAARLRQLGRRERFIWTTGAWLIYEFLEKASPGERKRLEAAIEAGDITWHALPFTMHCELMDASLFRYGLRLAQELDRRFGKRTITAKMTDVPGHTRAIVPLLAEAGIRFLHIGVNEASRMPDVPPVFVWRDDGGAEIVVMYQHSYGGAMILSGMPDAITFAHTLDNVGPQSAEQVIHIFREIERAFPQANVIASTLDAYAQALLSIRSRLPVVTQEIGDTWIHGVATDPKKVSQFHELCRLRNQWLGNPATGPDEQTLDLFSRHLLLVAEHTWGLDVKVHLADTISYGRNHFDSARAQANFQKVAASWAEQRAYLEGAIEALGNSPFAREAHARLKAIEPGIPDGDGYAIVSDLSRDFDTTHFVLRFNPSCGAVAGLLDKKSGQRWASSDHLLGLVRYQTFSQPDYDRYLAQYLASRPEWAEPDFSKPGLARAGGESRWWQPVLSRLRWRENEAGHYFLLEMKLPDVCIVQYGGPRFITLALLAPKQEPALLFDLQWFQKPANRQPEALWFSFCPLTGVDGKWTMDKMGKHISPLDVVRNGNRKLHAVGRGVFYSDDQRGLIVETLDAPLVAPGKPSLLNFDNEQPLLEKGMHFNLYNNVWGTNFPLWYDEDARFRFALRFS
ncbi:MAG TPA: DUF5054 domain-containing protein, partial [Anaerolineae bacterium]